MPIPEEVLILDAGNSIIKAKTHHAEIAYPHAMHTLTETEFTNIMTRAGANPPENYLMINGKPFVVGDAAERHGTLTHRTGAARYTPDYYGVFVGATLAMLYNDSCDVALFGSHAPGDVAFREHLMRAGAREYDVVKGRRHLRFRVRYANTFDEPVGGLMNILLTPDGEHYQRSDVRDGRSLVIDVGGHTTDWLAVNPGGEVDYALNESTPIGIQDVMRDFERSFRDRNRDATMGVSQLPPNRIRNAIITGVFFGGGREYDCHNEVDEAASVLLNRIQDTYQNVAGGALPWDYIILTGGGSAMLYDKLVPILKHDKVLLSEKSNENHLANVRGGMKLWKLYQANHLL